MKKWTRIQYFPERIRIRIKIKWILNCKKEGNSYKTIFGPPPRPPFPPINFVHGS